MPLRRDGVYVNYRLPFEQRFLRSILFDGRDECWHWTGSLDGNGYGRMKGGSGKLKSGAMRFTFAHQFAYEFWVGPVPEGLILDHLCHNADASCRGLGKDCPHRRCVNPYHLEATTRAINSRRGCTGKLQTHCEKGHEFTDANTYWQLRNGSIHRYCRICRAIISRKWRRDHPGKFKKKGTTF